MFTSAVAAGPAEFSDPACAGCIYNSTGRSIRWRMKNPGRYDILLQGLAPYINFRDVFHVDALGGNQARCVLTDFGAHHTELIVHVTCTDASDYATPARFMLSAQFETPGGITPLGLGVARFIAQNFYPYSSYNSSGAGVVGSRESVGRYYVLFQNLFLSNGLPMVTTQSVGVHCNPYARLAHQGGTQMYVACFTTGGTLVDADFWLSYSAKNAEAKRAAGSYLSAETDLPGVFSAAIPLNQTHSGTAGGVVIVQRLGTGNYFLNFPAFNIASAISAHVVATGDTNTSCAIYNLTSSNAQVLCTANHVSHDSTFAFQIY